MRTEQSEPQERGTSSLKQVRGPAVALQLVSNGHQTSGEHEPGLDFG